MSSTLPRYDFSVADMMLLSVDGALDIQQTRFVTSVLLEHAF